MENDLVPKNDKNKNKVKIIEKIEEKLLETKKTSAGPEILIFNYLLLKIFSWSGFVGGWWKYTTPGIAR